MGRAPLRPNNPHVEVEGKLKETLEIKKPKPHPLKEVNDYLCGATCKSKGIRTLMPEPYAHCPVCGDALIWL